VSSTLGENECKGPGELDGHLYAVTLTQETDFELTMTPSGFDGAMGIYTASGAVVAVNAGSGTLHDKYFLPAGQYTIVAARRDHGGGSYTLTTPSTTQTGCVSNGMTLLGATIAGSVASTDCVGLGGSFWDLYSFRLNAGQSMSASVTVDQAAIVALFAETQNNTQLQQQAVAKGATLTINYTATQGGTYRVHVGYGGVGPVPINYTLKLN
jgi:hypothetical protein